MLGIYADPTTWTSGDVQAFYRMCKEQGIDTVIYKERVENGKITLEVMKSLLPDIYLVPQFQYEDIGWMLIRQECCIEIDASYTLERANELVSLLTHYVEQGLHIYVRVPANVEGLGLAQIVTTLDPIVHQWIPELWTSESVKAMYEQFPRLLTPIVPMFALGRVDPKYAQYKRDLYLYDASSSSIYKEAFQKYVLQYKQERLSMSSFPTNSKGMVINPLSVSQFQPGHSEFECGAFCVAILGRSSAPNIINTYSAPNLVQFAQDEYRKLTGSEGPTNTAGLSYTGLHTILKDSNLHYWDFIPYPTPDGIRAAIMHGYPVVVSVPEKGVTDLETGNNPYWWGASGGHYLIVVGNHPDGNFLCVDPAAVERGDGNLQTPKTPLPSPRHYKFDSVDFGTIVQMPWLPDIPNNNPVSWPPYQPDTIQPVQDVKVIYDPNAKQLLYISNNQAIKRENV